MRKWTVRVEDEIGDDFASFCDLNGVSISACLQTLIDLAVHRQAEHDGTPVVDWPEQDPVAILWRDLILRAREIDATRRRRPRS